MSVREPLIKAPKAEAGDRDQVGSPASAQALADELDQSLKKAGAALVGFADLSPTPAKPFERLSHGVCIAMPFNARLAFKPGRNKASKRYVAEYLDIRERLEPLVSLGVEIIEGHGYEARGFGYKNYFNTEQEAMNSSETLTANYQHKTTAARAGLGWIGKMGLLVNRQYGPHLWLATIITEAPLPLAEASRGSQCGTCQKCREACPAGAITGALWEPGRPRADLLDVQKCQAHRRKRGGGQLPPMCGLCLAACPFGQPKN